MILVFIGPPGGGKGTIAQMLARKGWVHFSMGQALRDHVKHNGKFAQKVEKILSNGQLVPDAIAFSVLKESVLHLRGKNIVFDGFPRNLDQTKSARKVLRALKQDFDGFVFIDVPEKIILKRLKLRRQCESCGKIYGTHILPRKKGICNVDGGKLIPRADDHPSVIRKRFHVYRTLTAPVLDWATLNYPVFRVDGSPSPNAVFKQVARVLSFIRAASRKRAE